MPPTPARAILITALVTMFATSLVWIGVGALLYQIMYREPPPFDVSVEHPEWVELGEEFVVRVRVKNPTDEVLQLGSIDVYQELLDGFEVVSVDPAPNSTNRSFDFTSFYLKNSISPQREFVFTMNLRAKEVGYWAGDIDCCTPLENFVTHFTEISVIDPAEEADIEAGAVDSPPGTEDER